MIIFGTRGVTYSKEKGDFNCPECATRRHYDHKCVRRFFTLYFIPLIPLNLLGEYVECESCRATYKLEVLTYDPDAGRAEFEAQYHHAVKQVMIGLMLADGRMEEEEVQRIAEIYLNLTGHEISHAQVRSEAQQTDPDSGRILARMQGLAPWLNDHGKEMVLRAAFLVASADGEFQSPELDVIAALGEALGMTRAHVEGVWLAMQRGE